MLADKILETMKTPREVISMLLNILYVFVPLIASIIYLSQIGLYDNYAAVAQAVPLTVPLIPINSGNATLDQGLPVFYQCLEEVVSVNKRTAISSMNQGNLKSSNVTTRSL